MLIYFVMKSKEIDMINKLKYHYKDLLVSDEINNKEDFHWFCDDLGVEFGISNTIDDNELELLKVLFKQVNPTISKLTKSEKSWQNVLRGNIVDIPFLPARFLYFNLDKAIDNISVFKEAIQGLLIDEHCILWKNSVEGVIIEKYQQDDDIDYEAIVDIVATDFYINMRINVGNIFKNAEELRLGIAIEKKCVQFAKKLSGKSRVRTINELIPMFAVSELDKELKSTIWKVVLKDTLSDLDLLETIIIFLQNNLNVSQTAKKQFLHRNSVQYRVDKFIEKTGIDVRTLSGASLVQLALICRNDILYKVHKEED